MGAVKTKTVLLAPVVFGLGVASPMPGDEAAPMKPTVTVTDVTQLPVEEYPWGTLTWLCNAKFAPRAMQTLGIAEILPGKRNALHSHPNCEEIFT